MNDLSRIHPMYQFSLKAFKVVFAGAIEKAEPSEDVKARVHNLIDSITYYTFIYTTRGLFEKHKLIFTSQMSFLVGSFARKDFFWPLIFSRSCWARKRSIRKSWTSFFDIPSWSMSPRLWTFSMIFPGVASKHSLKCKNSTTSIEISKARRNAGRSSSKWKHLKRRNFLKNGRTRHRCRNSAWCEPFDQIECSTPWGEETSRSQSISSSLDSSLFVEEKLGKQFVENRSIPFSKSYEETNSSTPVFFILSPGVDPIKEVEAMGKKLGFSMNLKTFHNISLGQGQQIVAEEAMDVASKEGHWVVLQNIHLGWKDVYPRENRSCGFVVYFSGQMVTAVGEEIRTVCRNRSRKLPHVHVCWAIGWPRLPLYPTRYSGIGSENVSCSRRNRVFRFDPCPYF